MTTMPARPVVVPEEAPPPEPKARPLVPVPGAERYPEPPPVRCAGDPSPPPVTVTLHLVTPAGTLHVPELVKTAILLKPPVGEAAVG